MNAISPGSGLHSIGFTRCHVCCLKPKSLFSNHGLLKDDPEIKEEIKVTSRFLFQYCQQINYEYDIMIQKHTEIKSKALVSSFFELALIAAGI